MPPGLLWFVLRLFVGLRSSVGRRGTCAHIGLTKDPAGGIGRIFCSIEIGRTGKEGVRDLCLRGPPLRRVGSLVGWRIGNRERRKGTFHRRRRLPDRNLLMSDRWW